MVLITTPTTAGPSGPSAASTSVRQRLAGGPSQAILVEERCRSAISAEGRVGLELHTLVGPGSLGQSRPAIRLARLTLVTVGSAAIAGEPTTGLVSRSEPGTDMNDLAEPSLAELRGQLAKGRQAAAVKHHEQ